MTTVIKDWYFPEESKEIENFDLHTPAGGIVSKTFYETDKNVITILPKYDIDYECFGEFLPFLLDYDLLASDPSLKEIKNHVKGLIKRLEASGEILKYRKQNRDQA
jgi:hypothetical protein